MPSIKQFVTDLFQCNHIHISAHRMDLFHSFLQDEQNKATIDSIIQNQNLIMEKWKQQERIADIIQQPVRILNATVGKPYEAKIDLDKWKWNDIAVLECEGLEAVGLTFDKSTRQIIGTPTQSGDIKVILKFKLQGQGEEAPFNEKTIPLIINPDPKSLWKNIESNKDDPYWKEDNVTLFAPLGDRHILVSSKRGRSHANNGSFREDDFAFSELDVGWNIVVLADGAGSAKLSRKGSAIACTCVVDYFKEPASMESMAAFDELLQQYHSNTIDETSKSLNRFVYNNLGKAAFIVHKKLEEFSKTEGVALKDLSTTLIFCVWKKYDIGYAFLSFGVGDCPIAILNKDVTEVTLMNWLDVGEFGGGTRFITMPEVFKSEKFATRFSFKLMDDFSYLMLMSDGIYDAKFVVEANLPNIQKWQELLADIGGKNEDGITVELNANNQDITNEFSQWMDFWSAGNHDDRTLAIVF